MKRLQKRTANFETFKVIWLDDNGERHESYVNSDYGSVKMKVFDEHDNCVEVLNVQCVS